MIPKNTRNNVYVYTFQLRNRNSQRNGTLSTTRGTMAERLQILKENLKGGGFLFPEITDLANFRYVFK